MYIHLHYYQSDTPRTYGKHDFRTILVGPESNCDKLRKTERNDIR